MPPWSEISQFWGQEASDPGSSVTHLSPGQVLPALGLRLPTRTLEVRRQAFLVATFSATPTLFIEGLLCARTTVGRSSRGKVGAGKRVGPLSTHPSNRLSERPAALPAEDTTRKRHPEMSDALSPLSAPNPSCPSPHPHPMAPAALGGSSTAPVPRS